MKKLLGIILLVVLVVLVAGGFVAWKFYSSAFKPNVDTGTDEERYFYVHTGWELADVKAALEGHNLLLDLNSFDLIAEKKNYANLVKPGRYLIKGGMSNAELVDLLRSGVQVPLDLTYNNVRDLPDLAGKLAKYIEPDSIEMLSALQDQNTISHYGFQPHTFVAMFLPNTYEVHWNTSTEEIINRMAREYKAFWSDARRAKAKALNLDPVEVTTLASIVKAETNMADERARVAGVYINRIRIGMPLQADPTLVFILNDPSITRVLNQHKEIDSPYNTYLNRGLPPGPINMPESTYIDAVLNYEDHDYLYFCAAEDLSGRSNFSKTYNQHLVYARRYQRALNERGIYK